MDSLAKGKDLQAVAKSYSDFIRKGDKDTEVLLILALMAYGDRSMAQNFLNCGNSVLEEAGKRWAYKHGYMVMPASISKSSIRWGGGK